LVAAFVGFEPPVQRDEDVIDADDAAPPTWLGGNRSIVAPADLANAATPADAIAAAERLFFGEVKDVEQLRR
jgi:hypothetical protein